LLRKQVRVDAIRLNGLKLHLARAANGTSNWDDLTKKKATAPNEPKAPSTDPSAALGVFTVNRIEVTNSEFTWRDQAADTNYALRRVELKSGNLLGNAPVPFHLAFDFESGKPPVSKRVQLDARLHLNPSTEALDVPELKLALGDLKVHGQARGTNVLSAPALSGRIDVPAFSLRSLLQELKIDYVPADEKTLRKVALGASFDHKPQGTALSDVKLTLDETHLTGNAVLQRQPKASYRFDLAVDAIDIDRYLPATKETKEDDKNAAAAVVIPLALLRDTDADGQLRIQQLKAWIGFLNDLFYDRSYIAGLGELSISVCA
jgi:AsmA protein